MTTLVNTRPPAAQRRLRVPGWVPGASGLLIVFVLWWVVGAFGTIGTAAGGSSAVPTPFAVAGQLADDGFTFYWRNASVTLTAAATGFAVGNLLAVLTASLVLIAPWLEGIATQLAVITYCLPLIAIGPVVYAVGGQPATANVLAGLSVYFVTVVTTIQGLKSADRAGLDVITVAGGSRLHQLTKVQLIGAIPYVFTALKIAAPAAVLGAILGEYVGGITRGLGPAMVAAQGNNVERLWALAIVGVVVAGIAYAVIALIGRLATPWTRR
ncbi:ABC transporter permease [Nesterenkonia alkaliphila]|uniref:ABC transporter permease subunit n=1 Tax=Nesterenkonia alkaliphila TaxID=1463631 RepID=A0A7K1UJQ1_9MICC|nr:ABC transporter permease subunit [Nesterenkonia alkaliphila]MVT26690.1 ABC transporter permease subunit [Nesterenkonia alkaliphila]GFZ76767.1 ABC transporter ATP-binding protein [Nesterenkonia alkaliphila]